MKISIVLLCLYLGLVTGYEVYWNAPTNECSSYKIDFVGLLKQYGIIVNTGGHFRGDKIIIFYDSQLGIHPKLINYTTPQNGGIPQKVNMTEHLEMAEVNITEAIESKDFRGPAVIDWEAWRPNWEFNSHTEGLKNYQKESVRYARERFPNATNLTDIARQEWDSSAKKYFLETLQLGKRLRPGGLWGFYGFPDCYMYGGSKRSDFACPAIVKKEHDGLSWMFEESTATYPHIYMGKDDDTKYTFEVRTWKDDGILREALRVASPKSKIYPYINYYSNRLHPAEDMKRIMAQSAAGGSDGTIIWGGSGSVGTKDRCFALKDFVISVLGPASEKVAYRSDLCSKEICNGRGRCFFPDDEKVQKWKLFLSDEENFYAGDITCRCSENYTGRFCEKSV